MDAFRDALTQVREGTIISLEVTAGSKRTSFPSGYNSWRRSIGCHVREPPLEGKANAAIVRLLAEFFSVPPERIRIISGAGSSHKKVIVTGMDMDQVIGYIKGSRDEL